MAVPGNEVKSLQKTAVDQIMKRLVTDARSCFILFYNDDFICGLIHYQLLIHMGGVLKVR